MRERHEYLIKALEEALSEPTVRLKDYARVIIALRRCRTILDDMLPHLPEDKKAEAQFFMSLIGDVQQDASHYANIDYLQDCIRPIRPPKEPKTASKRAAKKPVAKRKPAKSSKSGKPTRSRKGRK